MSKPKISINKLGEYLESNPSRRKKIVYDQKNPQPFIVARYIDAKEITLNNITNNFNAEIVLKGIENIEQKKSNSDFQINDQSNSIKYLERLIEFKFPDLNDFKISKYKGSNPKIKLNGVEVSVNPDLIIHGNIKGKKIVGALKLHYSKNNSLNKESAKNVATLIHKFVEDNIKESDEIADIKHCYSVDINSEIIEAAPKSYLRRRIHIEDACSEIEMWWRKL